MNEGAIFLQLIFRIIGVLVCVNRAKQLNRDSGGWGFFGFILPIIAMIWIYCLKPVMKWDENVNIRKKE